MFILNSFYKKEVYINMFFLIYKITNTLNNKIYIGKHITHDKNDNYMGSGVALKKDIQKFGLKYFKKEILFECKDEKELNEFESTLVNEEFIQRNDTYNLITGGDGGWGYINNNHLNNKNKQYKKAIEKHLEKLKTDLEYAEYFCARVRQGLSKINKQEQFNKLKCTWALNGHPWMGRHHKPETIKKMKEKAKGRGAGTANNNFGKCWIYNDEQKINKSIKKEELSQWIENGWKKGRKMKF